MLLHALISGFIWKPLSEEIALTPDEDMNGVVGNVSEHLSEPEPVVEERDVKSEFWDVDQDHDISFLEGSLHVLKMFQGFSVRFSTICVV